MSKEIRMVILNRIKRCKCRIYDAEDDDVWFISIVVNFNKSKRKTINIPFFKKDIYKNMKENHLYTLKELGL